MKNYKLNPNILAKSNKDNTEINIINFEEDSDDIFCIKDISVDFWKFINMDVSKENIINQLLEVYNVDKKTIDKDLDTFIKDLKSNKILF